MPAVTCMLMPKICTSLSSLIKGYRCEREKWQIVVDLCYRVKNSADPRFIRLREWQSPDPAVWSSRKHTLNVKTPKAVISAMSDIGSGDEGGQKYHVQGMDGNGGDFGDPGHSGGQQTEQELATKMLQIQSKRFYLDVKQNRRGRFIKVAEIGADGRRSQIFLALSTAAEFRDHLSTFSDYYASLGPPNPESVPEDGKLKSEMMIKDNRRYYLDLKENARGRFLRVSQTITRGGPRSQIAIPAQGMIEFRDALTDLLEEFGTNDGGFKGELPEGRHMKVDNKNFYFDIGQNNRGIYMRISEVKSNFRTAITVPEKCWSRFRDILSDYCDKMKKSSDTPITAETNLQTSNSLK